MVESWSQNKNESPLQLILTDVLYIRKLTPSEKLAQQEEYLEGDTRLPWFGGFTSQGSHLVVVSDNNELLRKTLKKLGYDEHYLSELG